MGRAALLVLAAGAAAVLAHGDHGAEVADNVLDLTPTTFKEHVGKDVPAFVAFMAPWCVARRAGRSGSGRRTPGCVMPTKFRRATFSSLLAGAATARR